MISDKNPWCKGAVNEPGHGARNRAEEHRGEVRFRTRGGTISAPEARERDDLKQREEDKIGNTTNLAVRQFAKHAAKWRDVRITPQPRHVSLAAIDWLDPAHPANVAPHLGLLGRYMRLNGSNDE